MAERVVTGDTPGAPNGPAGAPAQPGVATVLRADPRREYVSGGVGGSGTWYQNVARTLPWAVDDITQDFGDDLYERMLCDPQVASVVNLFKAAILEDGLALSPALEDEDADGYALAAEIADAATAMLADLDPDMDAVLWNLLDALALGNRVAEQVYDLGGLGGREGLLLTALRVKPRHMTAFVVDGFLRLLGLVAFIPGVGAPVMQGFLLDPKETPNLLPRQKFAVLSFRPRDSDPRGTSVLRPAYTPWQLKQQIIREHVKYLTQFASPSLIGTTPEHAQPALGIDALGNPIIDPATGKPIAEQSPEQLMLTQLLSFKNASALAFPFGSQVDVIQSAGSGEAFGAALDRYDREIVKAILSQTLATEEGEHQARAAASVHQDVADTIVRQAKRAVQRAVGRDVLRPWVSYNWGREAARRLVPRCTLGHPEEQDLPALWTAAAGLARSGYLAPSQYQTLDRRLGLPERTAEEASTLEEQQAASPDESAEDGGDERGEKRSFARFADDGEGRGHWVTWHGRHVFIADGAPAASGNTSVVRHAATGHYELRPRTGSATEKAGYDPERDPHHYHAVPASEARAGDLVEYRRYFGGGRSAAGEVTRVYPETGRLAVRITSAEKADKGQVGRGDVAFPEHVVAVHRADPPSDAAAPAELRLTFRPAERKEALQRYTHETDSAVNSFLRRGGDPHRPQMAAREIAREVQALDAAIAAAPALRAEMTVYRGIDHFGMAALGWDDNPRAALGTTLMDRGFVSTTSSKSVAARFADNGAVLEIHVPSGVRALSLAGLSAFDDEGEHLLGRGATFRVTGVDTTEERPRIRVEYVGAGDGAVSMSVGAAAMSRAGTGRLRRFVWSAGDLIASEGASEGSADAERD